jgi:hypothetical protein
VAIHSLFTVLVLYAGKTECIMAKVDIMGAFIQTPMTGTPVYVRLNRNTAKYVIELFPEWSRYLMKDGVLYTKMLKAMYGCVQASRLWFELLTGVLQDAGYKSAAKDKCIMCKTDNGGTHVNVIYVDDLLILASREEINVLWEILVNEFRWITMEVQDSVSYLGMQINRWDNQFKIEMHHYLEKILQPYAELPMRCTPGIRTVYQVDESAEKLKENPRSVTES